MSEYRDPATLPDLVHFCALCGTRVQPVGFHSPEECRRLAALRGDPSHAHDWQVRVTCRGCGMHGEVIEAEVTDATRASENSTSPEGSDR